MKTTKNHFSASLESFDEGTDVMLDHTDTVGGRYEYAEMVDGREIENRNDEIESAETDIASLESLLEAITDARDVGMESWSAQFATIQVKAIQKRYGINDPLTVMPALESFNGRQARLATTVSMETVGETIAKVWQWIKEKIGEFVDLVRHYWNRLIRSLDYIYNEADIIKKKALSNTWSGNKTIDLPLRTAKRLAVKGQVPQNAEELVASLAKFQNLNKVSHETLTKVHSRITAQLESSYTKGTSKPYSAEVMVPQGWTEVAHTPEKSELGTERYSAGDAKTFCSPTLPGDLEIRITVYGEANQASTRDHEDRKSISAKPYIVDVPSKEPQTEVRVLSSSEVVSMCKEIQLSVDRLKDSRRHFDQHLSAVKRDISAITNRHVKITGNTAEQQLASLAIRSAMKAIYKNSVVYGTKLTQTCEKVAFNGLTACLSYAKHSVVAHAGQEQEMRALPAPAV